MNGLHSGATRFATGDDALAGTVSAGPHLTPKGLRHSYGVHAITSGVLLNMLQKWLGHLGAVIPLATGGVVDAFALVVDIALDEAAAGALGHRRSL